MEGEEEDGTTEIETTTNSFSLFHVITSVLGFILYMHQQIPTVLPDISADFDTLKSEFKQLESDLAQTELKSSLRRKQLGRMREVKLCIRRLQNFIDTVNGLETALKLLIAEVRNVQQVILILGPSTIRPQWAYELRFVHGSCVFDGKGVDFTESRVAEAASKKVVRTLISKGAGSCSYPGPTKLFLLVQAPPSFNLPLHFLPKRDFRYSRKIVPYKLRVKCRSQELGMIPSCAGQSRSSMNQSDSVSKDSIWFQCRHVIKGLAFKTPEEE